VTFCWPSLPRWRLSASIKVAQVRESLLAWFAAGCRRVFSHRTGGGLPQVLKSASTMVHRVVQKSSAPPGGRDHWVTADSVLFSRARYRLRWRRMGSAAGERAFGRGCTGSESITFLA
jgi:hypothetical protein